MTEKLFIHFEQLENFNEIFRKDVTYDNIKSHKNQDFTSLQKIYFLKYTGRGQIHHPSCFRVNAPLASDNPSRFRKNILVRI